MGAHDDGTYAGAVPTRPSDRTPRRPLARVAVALAVVLLPVLLPLDAGADGARPSNFESVIDSVDPDLDQVDVRIVGGDAFVQVRAEPGTEVQIPGYDGEPYLRIDADGDVWRNRRSSATYLNETRTGEVAELPEQVDSSADPDWERVGDGGVVAWHDHRVHWMLSTAPETADGVVQEWVVPMDVDGTEVSVSGRLLLRPDVTPWPAAVALAVAALVAWRARGERARRALLAAASLVALSSSIVWYLANPPGASPSVLPLALAALALVAAVAGRFAAPTLRRLVLPLGSVALLAGWSVQRVGVLWMPTLPSPWPDVLERVITAAVIGIAAGVAIAVVLRPVPVGGSEGSGGTDPSTPDDQGASTRSSSSSQSSTPPRS
jgi:hypothetical protein